MSAIEKLASESVVNELGFLKGWRLEGQVTPEIVKNYEFKSFRESMLFVNAVAFLAEQMNHHPDISVSYNKVNLALVTHDAGGLTRLDFELARKIDGLGGFGR